MCLGSPRSSRQFRCGGIAVGRHSAIVSLESHAESRICWCVSDLLRKRTRTLAVTSVTTVSTFELCETESLLRVPSNCDSSTFQESRTRAESVGNDFFSENRLHGDMSSVHSEPMFAWSRTCLCSLLCFSNFVKNVFSRHRLTCMIAYYRDWRIVGMVP